LGAEMLVDSRKTLITDKRFDSNESNTRFANHVFVRLVAMGRTFTKVDFRYTFLMPVILGTVNSIPAILLAAGS
jgi:hypothetical protein